jgi:integrase
MAAVFERLDGTDGVAARRDAAIIAVMYSSGGVRRTELVRLDLADLEREAGELRVRSGKGRKDRLVHLGDEAGAALADWLDVRGLEPGPLFLPVAKDRLTLRQGDRLDPTTVRLACQRRADLADVATFSPHDLRRTSISDLLDLTGDLALVSRLAGHASPSTTRRYDRRPVETERRAARSLHVPYRSRRVAR